MVVCFLFRRKTAYEMRISDLSSGVCSSDLAHGDDRRFIGGCPFNQGVGDTGGQRIPHRRLGRAGALEALVAFYAPAGVFGGIAFLGAGANAVNAAVPLLEHPEGVANNHCKRNAPRTRETGRTTVSTHVTH